MFKLVKRRESYTKDLELELSIAADILFFTDHPGHGFQLFQDSLQHLSHQSNELVDSSFCTTFCCKD